MKVQRFLILAISYLIWINAGGVNTYVSPTRYDWSGLAYSITSPSKSNYDKAYDIYRWLCENIAYDTSYTIHTADETYERKRGVCQGYAELYYYLANAVGMKADIVSGKSKGLDGSIGDIGHAWLFVYIDESSGILVDPTWGAGYVNDNRFTRMVNDTWFHFKPEWGIFTHYPEDYNYQLMSNKISFEQFRDIPYLSPSLSRYGYDGNELLNKVLSGEKLSLPVFYEGDIDKICEAIYVPKEKDLRVGQNYEFYIKPKGKVKLAVINGDEFDFDWNETDSQTAIRYMPCMAGPLKISYENGNNTYTTLIEYTVAQPTAKEITALEMADPLKSPALKRVTNYNRKLVESLGIDPHSLLFSVKAQKISSMPVLSNQVSCRLKSIPLNGTLKAGQNYTFKVIPGEGIKWAVINGDEWIYQSEESIPQEVVINVTPKAGELKLAAKTIASGNSFKIVATYNVK
ncbi:MAG: hypothetical protein NC201_07700 [Prevotella sp.]|nr:hypothetical protein [Bacteroides sp.]MCM1367112.1 hypothetical protein [Prevotella sp.]MCM1437426.1 hypothetical protein [Prevotella sp.]